MHHVLFHYSVGLSIPAHLLSQLDLSQRWIFSSSTEKSVGANLTFTFTQASNLVQAQSLLWPQPPACPPPPFADNDKWWDYISVMLPFLQHLANWATATSQYQQQNTTGQRK